MIPPTKSWSAPRPPGRSPSNTSWAATTCRFPATKPWNGFRQAGYDLLPITPAHAAAVEHLPDRHRDPFDRLLIAQAITEPLRLLSHDPLVVQYGTAVIAV